VSKMIAMALAVSTKADFEALLRQHSCKVTRPRLAVLAALEEAGAPLSVQQLRARLRPTRLDQATVYRTLKTLKEAGLVQQIDWEHGHAHYELALGPHHHHVVCTRCQRVEDITDCAMDELAAKVLRGSDFATITHHSLEFFGVCRKCRAAE